MSEMITADLVDLDLSADTKEAAARSLAERMVAQGRVTDLDGFLADVAAREAQMPTGLDGGIGIPHCRSAHVTEPTLAFGRATQGIDFGAADGPADLVFLIAAPAGADSDHLTILSSLARQLMDAEFTGALRSADDAERAAALIRGDADEAEAADEAGEVTDGPTDERADERAAERAGESTGESTGEAADEPSPAQVQTKKSVEAPAHGEGGGEGGGRGAPFKIVAVTSCPTGIAHTYMAAESLENAGREAGVEVVVETQGSAGFTRLDPAVVAAADGVIFAHDVPVRDKERFAGKPTVDVGVKAGINRPAELIADVRGKAERGEVSSGAAAAPVDRAGDEGDSYGTKLRKWLMSGVSYMVPFVAAGGLLIALGFAIGGYEISEAKSVAEHFVWTEAASWAALLFQVGGLAFSFLVPVLAGYIAYGMADRPGLVPGFVGGAVAVQINAGFLGGLAAGLIAGATVMAIQKVRIPAVLRGIMPVVVIPLISSAVVGFLMFLVVGKPIATLQSGLSDWLESLTGANAIILGVILGLMMCFDLGGPLNKVAYAFAVGGLGANATEGNLKVMAAVMAAGMVPPLAMALATTVRGKLFTKAERENGKAAWVLGASFITEGAIPFAAADPLRVIPASMAGGAVTGALTMSFGATLRAPHGGVFVVPLIGQPLLYLLAIVAGTCVSAGLVILLKGMRRTGPEQASAKADEAASAKAAEAKNEPVAAV
ncbi:fructose-specific PTS transporter subunit EIIC [Streptomyces sp. LHD-70]|uniref:PTS fructose transporter subunit IIABC n=1 Tax=Streptomyces sp. LHD-70 TaxID=3072140 RepID=UPI00281070A9|nr:fructose-specific PTS transporter subunit EIIC [Streptomyces sp. LHD-70]MDQ8706797.1 fructose-specific PTS transporter subunit EIIC [Streptomyces sp. LHD-70]